MRTLNNFWRANISIVKKNLKALCNKAQWRKLKGKWQQGGCYKKYGKDELNYNAKKSLKIQKKNVQRAWKVDFQSETYKWSISI